MNGKYVSSRLSTAPVGAPAAVHTETAGAGSECELAGDKGLNVGASRHGGTGAAQQAQGVGPNASEHAGGRTRRQLDARGAWGGATRLLQVLPLLCSTQPEFWVTTKPEAEQREDDGLLHGWISKRQCPSASWRTSARGLAAALPAVMDSRGDGPPSEAGGTSSPPTAAATCSAAASPTGFFLRLPGRGGRGGVHTLGACSSNGRRSRYGQHCPALPLEDAAAGPLQCPDAAAPSKPHCFSYYSQQSPHRKCSLDRRPFFFSEL